jgi:AraC family transcriptional regulator, glycine betaine-responsive activator
VVMLYADRQERPYRIGFLLLPNFSLIAFTSAIEPLRLANRLSGRPLYDWRLYSEDGQSVASSSGAAVMVDSALDGDAELDLALVCSGIDVHLVGGGAVAAWLRRLERRGGAIGALCTGSHVLARAGLLNNHRCTIHWENIVGFVEEFPDLEVTAQIYEIDRNRYTCAGGTAAIDLMLEVIAEQHGIELAGDVAEQIIHERIRDQSVHQRLSLPGRLGVRHPKLLSIIETMENNLEEPLGRSELAEQAGLSTRQLERLFRRYLNRSPARYYLEMRLHRARLLLLQTNLSVMNVALACGFVSASHFTKCYRAFFGRTPYRERGLPKAVDADAPRPRRKAAASG